MTHDFRTLENRWDCSFCHASGPGAMQTSFVSLAQEDGRNDDAQELVLRDVEDREISLPLHAIEEKVEGGSLMPVGLAR